MTQLLNMKSPIKYFSLVLTASVLFLPACGKPAEASDAPSAMGEVTISDAPDAAMKTIFMELAKGEGGIIWKAMPASYQADLNSVVQLAGTKIDAEVYDKSFQLIDRLGSIINQQQALILNSSMGPALEEEKVMLRQGLPKVAEIIRVIATSDVGTNAGLQSFNGQVFFGTTVSKLASLTTELSKLQDAEGPSLEDLRDADIAVLDVTEMAATLSITMAGDTQTVQLTKIENRWVPVDIAAQWTASITEVKTGLEAFSPKAVAAAKADVMNVFKVLDDVMSTIEAAETQADFDQSLKNAMMPLMGVYMAMMETISGGAPAAP